MELPKEVQEAIIQYQALQNQLSVLEGQKAAIEADEATIKDAIDLIEKSGDDYVYKAAGAVLVRMPAEAVKKELEERLEALQVRKKNLEKKIGVVRSRLLELKKKIESALSSVSGGESASSS